jgi:RNA polymerase sigma-70 factor, ECF subfamily
MGVRGDRLGTKSLRRVLCSRGVSEAEGGASGHGDGEFRREAVACLDGLYGFALSLTRDRRVAEDLVQETYVRALAAPRKAGPGENMRAWLFTILHNAWRNERRRKQPTSLEDAPGLAERLVAPGADPEDALGRKETRALVRRAIAGLPESFREVIVLRCLEGFSYRDLAQILGCPAGTVMSRLARARAILRRDLSMPPVAKDGAA